MLDKYQSAKCCILLQDVALYRSLMERPNLLNQKGLAAFLGVDRVTVYRWHEWSRSAPPRVLIGKRFYYSYDAVRVWLEANAAHSSSASHASSQAPGELQTTG